MLHNVVLVSLIVFVAVVLIIENGKKTSTKLERIRPGSHSIPFPNKGIGLCPRMTQTEETTNPQLIPCLGGEFLLISLSISQYTQSNLTGSHLCPNLGRHLKNVLMKKSAIGSVRQKEREETLIWRFMVERQKEHALVFSR